MWKVIKAWRNISSLCMDLNVTFVNRDLKKWNWGSLEKVHKTTKFVGRHDFGVYLCEICYEKEIQQEGSEL